MVTEPLHWPCCLVVAAFLQAAEREPHEEHSQAPGKWDLTDRTGSPTTQRQLTVLYIITRRTQTRTKVVWQKVTSFVCKKILSISSIIFARWQNESRKLVLRGANEIAIFGEGEVVGVSDATIRKSDGGFLYVTIALSLTSRPQFAIEYIRCSNQQRGGLICGKICGRGWPM